jgi:dihydroorotase
MDLGLKGKVALITGPALARRLQRYGRQSTSLPIHTPVRARFVMRDRTLVEGTKGLGQSVHPIQSMPRARPRNTPNRHG